MSMLANTSRSAGPKVTFAASPITKSTSFSCQQSHMQCRLPNMCPSSHLQLLGGLWIKLALVQKDVKIEQFCSVWVEGNHLDASNIVSHAFIVGVFFSTICSVCTWSVEIHLGSMCRMCGCRDIAPKKAGSVVAGGLAFSRFWAAPSSLNVMTCSSSRWIASILTGGCFRWMGKLYIPKYASDAVM